MYVGPTLDPAAARAILPGAQLMPPIGRGELYRDRLLGFSVFLILDGVFRERLAVSPREIVDVLQDGATVVGASSMGAIRAAECRPAGMHGVGTIYHLYRRGHLTSEDDVAVAFHAVPPYSAATVPLVNVRYAVGRARRHGLITPADGDRLVEEAARRHYTDRYWPDMIRVAGLADPDGTLRTFVEGQDLKRADAVRALGRVGAWAAENPHLVTDRASPPSTFRRGGAARECADEPTPSVDPRKFRQWLLASGSYRRRAADPDTVARIAPMTYEDAVTVVADLIVAADLPSLVWRFTAITRVGAWARHERLLPCDADRESARHDIAVQHGFADWCDLHDAVAGIRGFWPHVDAAAEELALAKRARRALFADERGAAETESERRTVRG